MFLATGDMDTVGKFAAGVVDTKLPPVFCVVHTGGKFAAGVANLPPVSTSLANLVAIFAAGVVDTGVHLDLRISPQIFKKN